MSDSQPTTLLAGPFVMFFSAALLGFFGFYYNFSPYGDDGAIVFIWALLLYTLQIGTFAMALAGLVTCFSRLGGNLLYAIFSGLLAISLVVLGVADIQDEIHIAPLPPMLAFLFAAWNGYSAWSGLREVIAIRYAPEPAENRTMATSTIAQIVRPDAPTDK